MSDQEEKQATEAQDNLVDVLDDFNVDEAKGEATEEVAVEPQGSGESGTPGSVGEGTTEEEREEAISWLIDNKFKDDDTGKTALATAYKELQSKTDKERNEYSDQAKKYEQLDKLDGYLRENPDVVKSLSERIKRDANDPPPKPEDYDILDEQIDGSASAEWRKQNDQYLINRGAMAAKQEIGQFKQEMHAREQQEAEVAELKGLGLNDSDIENFNSFMSDNNNLNNKNLVKIWKFLSQENSGNTVQKSGDKKKQTTAAASPGNDPVMDVDPGTKDVDQFWDGIMDNSRKV